MKLTVPAYQNGDIWYPESPDSDRRADSTWSEVARKNPIRAAAATGDSDPFAKFPEWFRPYFLDRPGTVLDGGCGYGRVSIPLLKANPNLRCIGVDASPVMLEKFVELAKERGVADRVELFCGNLDKLPFPDSSFEFVLSCAVLLHVPKRDVKGIIREFSRVLSNHGTLILQGAFPNAFNPEGILNIRNNFREEKNGPVRAYTRSEVKRLFTYFTNVTVEAHQMIVLPRSIGPVPMPFANVARRLNRFCTIHLMKAFKHSGFMVNHHDVVAMK